MKIVILSVWFSDKMGYIENCLPKALAKLGHDVHVISSTAQVYFNEPNYDIIYKAFIGERIQPVGISKIDGYTLHRLDFGTISNKIFIKNLKHTLSEINPDVVQAFDAFSFLTLQGAFYKLFLKYKFFTANHMVASVFPLFKKGTSSLFHKAIFFLTRTIPGKLISLATSRCYPATIDCLEIAVKYYGIPKHKVKLACLGVDTDFFYPAKSTPYSSESRSSRRGELGFKDDDLVCIYTGRFTVGKDPLILARAIDKLVKLNEPFKAIFLGNGPQLEEIMKMKGCTVHKLVPYQQLPDFYRLADIGIWPKQESTSMIDATACGLPIIISNRVKATERVEGNGLIYIENDLDDLVKTIIVMKDEKLRLKLSKYGIEKIQKRYSWDIIAKERIEDYKSFINNK